MKNEKKYPGVYLDTKTGKYYVSTTFMTKDGYAIKKCKRGFDTAKKADAWKNQTTIEMANTSYEATNNVKKGVEKLVDEYIEYKKSFCKPSTLSANLHSLNNYFIPFFKETKNIKVSDITKAYQFICNSKMVDVTKNKVIGHITSFIDYLDLTESIDRTIYRKFKLVYTKVSVADKNIQVFTNEEVTKILSYYNTQPLDYTKLAICIYARTGCRLGECLGLKFSDLNTKNNELRFDKQCQNFVKDELVRKNLKYEKIGNSYIFFYTKTNSVKDVIIPEWLCEMILEFKYQKGASDNDYIFRFGKNICDSKKIRADFEKVLVELNIPHKKIHALRHFHTTELYDLGFDPKYIAERLGHADETTSLKVYKHLSKEVKEKNDELASKILN